MLEREKLLRILTSAASHGQVSLGAIQHEIDENAGLRLQRADDVVLLAEGQEHVLDRIVQSLLRDTWLHSDGTSGSDNFGATSNAAADFQTHGIYEQHNSGTASYSFYTASGDLLFTTQAYIGSTTANPTEGAFAQQTASGIDGPEMLQTFTTQYGSQSSVGVPFASGQSFNSLWALGAASSISSDTFNYSAFPGSGSLLVGGGGSGGAGTTVLPPGGGWAFPTADISSIVQDGVSTIITTVNGEQYLYYVSCASLVSLTRENRGASSRCYIDVLGLPTFGARQQVPQDT